MRSLRIICPNGHLGFAPIRVESFRLGVAARPDYIAADSGSDDVGPVPLGTDTSTSPLAWQTHDLEHMLLASRAARRADDHRLVGRHRRQQPRRPVRAASSRSSPRSIGCRGSRSATSIRRSARRTCGGACARAKRSRDSTAAPTLTEAELDATERIVAMAGVHPFIELLRAGRRRDHRRAQQRQLRVRRAGDPSRVSRGARVLPRQGARMRVVLRRALRRQGDGAGRDHRGRRRGHGDASAQRCTVASVAGHAMYERSNPYFEHVAGGTLDMSRVPLRADRRTGRRASPARVPARGRVSRQARRRGQDRRALRRHGRHPRSVHDRPCRRGDRLGAATGARALRRYAATSCTTPSTAATA